MEELWDLLKEFSKSELAKNYWIVFIILLFVCMFISGFLVWLYMKKIKFPSEYIELQNKVLKIEEIKKENKELIKQNQQLITENENAKREIQRYKFSDSINKDDDFEDKALYSFADRKD